MLIRLSEQNKIAPIDFENVIKEAAKKAECYASIAWTKPKFREIRFSLVDGPMSKTPATFDQHDQVITTLLMIDQGAYIRTAKFTYNGWADFHAQYVNSLPGERNDISVNDKGTT